MTDLKYRAKGSEMSIRLVDTHCSKLNPKNPASHQHPLFLFTSRPSFSTHTHLYTLFLLSTFTNMSAMERRKQELEMKRQKLAELRRAREERKAVLETQSTRTQSSTTTVHKLFSAVKLLLSS